MSDSTFNLYTEDFYAWANQQAALLRAGKLEAADIAHIAEEIESMGRGEKRELINRLAMLLMHLLKWQYQPGLRGNSWRLTIREQRIRLRNLSRTTPPSRRSSTWPFRTLTKSRCLKPNGKPVWPKARFRRNARGLFRV